MDDDGGKSGRRWVVGRKSSVRTGPSKKKHDQGRVMQLNIAGSGGDNEKEGAAWMIF